MYIGISFHSLQIEVTSKAVKTVQTNMPTHMVLQYLPALPILGDDWLDPAPCTFPIDPLSEGSGEPLLELPLDPTDEASSVSLSLKSGKQ